jgi:alkaline phosphatase
MFFRFLLLIFVLVGFNSCVSVKVSDNTISKTVSENKKPKNIILLIGDGMGLSEVSASQFYNVNPSNFERFNVIGLSKTSSSSDLITDSAAGATAMACGVLTYNGAIGVDKDTISVKNIVEEVSLKGLSTGVISTSSITHATPASFYAHVRQRRMAEEIAVDLVGSDIDFFAGGGLKYFKNRTDKLDLIDRLKENGFVVYTEGLPDFVIEKKQAVLLADNAMKQKNEGRGDFLPNATQKAIDKLSDNENGFFLMVEGSQIDWGGHDNDAEYLISELIDFDKTIGVALDFAESNSETLVIVTADHETGGFTLGSDNNNYNKINPVFSTGGHSATMVPVFAKGPGSEYFNGIYTINEIYHKMRSLIIE